MSLPDLAPLVLLLVLLEMALGAIAIVLVADFLGEVSRGFLATTALICAALMGTELAIAVALPEASQLLGGRLDVAAFRTARTVSSLFAIALGLYALFVGVGTDIARRVVGSGSLVLGSGALVEFARAVGPTSGGTGTALAALVPATLLVGTALAGMLLGHWYLISPDLSFRPLRRAIYAVFGAVAVYAAGILVAVSTAPPAQRAVLTTGRDALTFWLLVVGAGLVSSAGINALTLYFARLRANQPATAMLYGLIISVLMGIVPAQLLYFLTTVPV